MRMSEILHDIFCGIGLYPVVRHPRDLYFNFQIDVKFS